MAYAASESAPDGSGQPVNAVRPVARRITETAARAAAQVSEPRVRTEPVVDSTFASVCGTVLLSLLITAAILAMGTVRPVPIYAVVGSAIFGTVFGAFLMAALHLAITDSRRHRDEEHEFRK
jgi:hypothetical protein